MVHVQQRRQRRWRRWKQHYKFFTGLIIAVATKSCCLNETIAYNRETIHPSLSSIKKESKGECHSYDVNTLGIKYKYAFILRGGDSNNRMNFARRFHTNQNTSKHTPVVYQYFERKYRSRHSDEAPLNFLILGPFLDHWKPIGKILSSWGFNVMVCERMITDNNNNNMENYDDTGLVLEILDALKWEKTVLVGCDDESKIAMETAMILAPDRVAGLVLCGDLNKANQLAMEAGGIRVLDSFLHRVLDCPFIIVWDGGPQSVVSGSSAHEAIKTTSTPFSNADGRCAILGGGSSPHFSKPEYFAWVLARFVEEKLEYRPNVSGKRKSTIFDVINQGKKDEKEGGITSTIRQNTEGLLEKMNIPFGIDSLVSPEGRLLLGRAIAAAIFYGAMMKVVFVQYNTIKNSVDSVSSLRRKVFQATGAFISRIFKFSVKKAKEPDENGILNNRDDEDSSIESNGEIPLGKSSEESIRKKETDKEKSDSSIEGDDDNENTSRMKPLFFLDNIFT